MKLVNESIIRIIHVFGALNKGGAESRMMDIYRELDHSKIQFDFLVHTEKIGAFENEILKLGGRIFHIKKPNLLHIKKYKDEIKKIFMHNRFNILHGHMLSTAFIYMKIAKQAKIKVRIAHSRIGFRNERNLKELAKKMSERLCKRYATHLFAVSSYAAISAFGRKSFDLKMVQVINNAIPLEKYRYSAEVRDSIRKTLAISNEDILVGHIGRFEYQKNHKFLVDIFYNLLRQNPNYKLLLVGEGPLKNDIIRKIQELNISKNVILYGITSDVDKLLLAMDIMLLPSHYEGFPGVILESQASGLVCVMSDSITPEIKLTELIHVLSIKESPIVWSNFIKDLELKKRLDNVELLRQKGYDSKKMSEWYQEFYCGINHKT